MKVSAMILYALIDDYNSQILRKELALLVSYSNSCRVRNYLTSASLQTHGNTAWNHFYYSVHDDFMAVLGINRQSFETILEEFKKDYVVRSGPGRVGRPPRLQEKNAVLGIY